MFRLAAVVYVCLVAAACFNPTPRVRPKKAVFERPPALTSEAAKQALLQMVRERPDLLRGDTFDPPERLAAQDVNVQDSRVWFFGNFSIHPQRPVPVWHYWRGGRRGCLCTTCGNIELIGDDWVAKDVFER
jgi:hypothetical protein